jgi:hypothetical protein
MTKSRRKMLEAMRRAKEMTEERANPTFTFNALEELRKIAKVLISMAAQEQRREPQDKKLLVSLLEAASNVLSHIMPYEHRRLAPLRPSIDAVIAKDGAVHVTISRSDSDL